MFLEFGSQPAGQQGRRDSGPPCAGRSNRVRRGSSLSGEHPIGANPQNCVCVLDPRLAASVASRNARPYFRSGSRWQPSAHSFQALMNTSRSPPGKVLRSPADRLRQPVLVVLRRTAQHDDRAVARARRVVPGREDAAEDVRVLVAPLEVGGGDLAVLDHVAAEGLVEGEAARQVVALEVVRAGTPRRCRSRTVRSPGLPCVSAAQMWISPMPAVRQ